ncbi:MAG TPA: XrtA system polysaccharide chain length determinant [Alphaproteobacteria bacterium]|nr:XrtA system polysaccharide chain length determinant [Alphaproteobacteria bacterium]
MTPIKSLVRDYALAMWRRRWYAAGVAWLVCVGGWAFVAMMPNTYTAKTRIYVDADSMLRPLLRGIAIDTNVLNEVDIMQRTLLSRPNLQKVARLADLDLGAKTLVEQETVTTDLQRKLKISSQARSLFELTYEGTQPQQAKKVIQSLLDIFVEGNLGNSRRDMVTAQSFINEQIREYEKQLEQAERRLADFKAQNLGFLPGDNNYSAKLEVARNDVARTQGELAEARKSRDELRKQLAEVPKMIETVNVGSLGPDLGPPIGGGPGAIDSVLRVPELEQKLKTLRLRYTDRHPDVIETKRLLELAKQEEADRAAKEAEGGPAAPQPGSVKTTASNPVYEQLKLQLVQQETQIATLESRLERHQADVRRWEQLARSVPGVAAEMARLDRDYNVIKRNYDELLSRREAARIGQDLETQTKSVQFRLVDPPDVSAKPTGPNRPLLVSVVFVVGLGAGCVFAFFLSQLDNTMRHVEQVRAVFKLPILGGVSMIQSAWAARRNRIEVASFGLACLTLLGAYLGLLSIEAFITKTI